ncbi:unnamed protein product [Prorocentrum cordatum]|uniref:Uncharacterized protein n=1 Tax=Prorocentrum cordatum TaxID=2364126 RepID=A0ABN9VAQ9_9DINO|nr:unnamed protein product [Polarella glacialis]
MATPLSGDPLWHCLVGVWLLIITGVRLLVTLGLTLSRARLYGIYAGIFGALGLQGSMAKTAFAVLAFPARGLPEVLGSHHSRVPEALRASRAAALESTGGPLGEPRDTLGQGHFQQRPTSDGRLLSDSGARLLPEEGRRRRAALCLARLAGAAR